MIMGMIFRNVLLLPWVNVSFLVSPHNFMTQIYTLWPWHDTIIQNIRKHNNVAYVGELCMWGEYNILNPHARRTEWGRLNSLTDDDCDMLTDVNNEAHEQCFQQL